MIAVRKSNPIFAADHATCWLDYDNEHIALFARQQDQQALYVAVNFSDQPQALDLRRFVTSERATDLLTETSHERDERLALSPYGIVWLHSISFCCS